MDPQVVLYAWLLWPLTFLFGLTLGSAEAINPTPLKRKIGKFFVFLNLACSTILVIQGWHLISTGWDPVIESLPRVSGSAARKGGGLFFSLAYKFLPYVLIIQGVIGGLNFYAIMIEPEK